VTYRDSVTYLEYGRST